MNITLNQFSYDFGMQMPGRNGSTGEYRYGFQGQEKDDEVKGEGNSINYKYRMHDPRIGRFFAVDPLTKKYPHYSPYSFSGNKVIHAVELEGLEEQVVVDKQGNEQTIYGPFSKQGAINEANANVDSNSSGDGSTTTSGGNSNVSGSSSQSTSDNSQNTMETMYASSSNGMAEAGVYRENTTYSNGGVNAEVNTSALTAKAYNLLNDDGTITIGAEATVVNGNASASYQGENAGIKVAADGTIGHAIARTEGGIMMGDDGTYGMKSYAEAGAYTLKGEFSIDVNVYGYDATLTIGGSLVSAHAGGGFEAYYDSNDNTVHVVGLIHAGLGAGVKGQIDIVIPVASGF